MGTLPRQVEYALMALADMHAANPGQLFSVRRICEDHGVPFDVLSKTMQRLGRAGVLRSVKGVGGGYQIARDLATVSLLDLMQAVMGRVGVVNCLRKGHECRFESRCNVNPAMVALDRKLKELYRTTTVLELVEMAVPARRA